MTNYDVHSITVGDKPEDVRVFVPLPLTLEERLFLTHSLFVASMGREEVEMYVLSEVVLLAGASCKDGEIQTASLIYPEHVEPIDAARVLLEEDLAGYVGQDLTTGEDHLRVALALVTKLEGAAVAAAEEQARLRAS